MTHWGTLAFNAATPASTTLGVDVLSSSGAVLATNVASGSDLAALGITQSSIKLRGDLATSNSSATPALHDWTVTWQVPTDVYIEGLWSAPQQSIQDATPPVAPTINGLLNDANFGWDGLTNDPALSVSGLELGVTVEYRFSTTGDGGTYSAWGGNNPPQGAVAVEVRQRDGAGNVSAASAPFDFAFDSVAPTVIGVRVTLTTVTDAEVTPRPQDEEVVVVTYDSHLDWAYGRVPALGFTQPVLGDGVGGGPATFTLDPDNSFWIDNGAESGHAVYQFAYTLADNGVYYPNVGVVTGAGTTHDIAGNPPVTYTGTDDFSVNTATARRGSSMRTRT